MTEGTPRKVRESTAEPKAAGNRGKGRKKGVPNKATADIKAIAGQYSQEAIEALIGVVRATESDAARVSAIKELLDRAHGRANQSVDVDLIAKFIGLDVAIKR